LDAIDDELLDLLRIHVRAVSPEAANCHTIKPLLHLHKLPSGLSQQARQNQALQWQRAKQEIKP